MKKTKGMKVHKVVVDGQEHEILESSGNVFADLGRPNAGLLQLKSTMAMVLRAVIEDQGTSQAQAAEALGMTPQKLNDLLNGRASASVTRLFGLLNQMGRDITISERPHAKPGPGSVSFVSKASSGSSDSRHKSVRVRASKREASRVEPRAPNAKTRTAMREARRGGAHRSGTVSEFMADLNSD